LSVCLSVCLFGLADRYTFNMVNFFRKVCLLFSQCKRPITVPVHFVRPLNVHLRPSESNSSKQVYVFFTTLGMEAILVYVYHRGPSILGFTDVRVASAQRPGGSQRQTVEFVRSLHVQFRAMLLDKCAYCFLCFFTTGALFLSDCSVDVFQRAPSSTLEFTDDRVFQVLGGVDTGGEVGRRGRRSSGMLDTLMTDLTLALLWLLEFERTA
jgi:hypothetical protein